MAEDTEDKTEDPTQKRLDEALEKGDVVKSQEVNTWFIIAGATLVLSTFSSSIGSGILMPLRNLIANSWMIRTDGAGLLQLTQTLGYAVVAAIGVPFLMLALAAIAGNMIQHQLVWSGEQLKPKFSKISPAAGFKRLFGKQAVANFLKGLFKLIALGVVMVMVLWPDRMRMESFLRVDPAELLPAITGMTVHLLAAVVAILAAVANRRLLFPVPDLVRASQDVAAGDEGGVQAVGRRPAREGQDQAVAGAARQEAHDGPGSEGLGDHHKPDPLFGGAGLRPQHVGADLRRQGRRQPGFQDQGDRQGARHSDRRERAAGPGALCDCRHRQGNPGRALSCGCRNHRLRDAAEAWPVRPAPVRGGKPLEMRVTCELAA
ncbi:hypothetical protein ACVILK_001970 [Bradyrhizobium embrapense]